MSTSTVKSLPRILANQARFQVRCLPSSRKTMAMMSPATKTRTEKREGDISDAFASLEGGVEIPLEPRFADLKKRLLAGREDVIVASWNRLLEHLRDQVATIQRHRSKLIPEISFSDVMKGKVGADFSAAYKKYGVCIIRGVVDEQTALEYKRSILEYVAKNPHTKAFPQHDPQVFELYWSEAQLRARSHPNVISAQCFLMSFWNASQRAEISLRHPIAYADRLRIRQPGDSSFALGPHMDGGSLERWEEGGYALAQTYDKIFEGKWEEYDPWNADKRVGAVIDLYGGVGNCSAFRTQQAWLSISNIKGGEGHLKVNPLHGFATAYILLRPFFESKRGAEDVSEDQYLSPENWRLELETSPKIQGASPGHGQSVHAKLHPHLQLQHTMVHVPAVAPGDYVAWHCDTIHAVDSVHNGSQDSSVLYIPACPLTETNANYLLRQRDCFLAGKPSPDFGGGEGESRHVDRPTVAQLSEWGGEQGLQSMGLKKWNSQEQGLRDGEKTVMKIANSVLGFPA
ncbi:uncharacterized protein PV09_00891 [Verruconis gallopava]|uniref:DUF1479 domain protein n=1 Tax=Verruconis gallopava TaxID=253628 RepID=A0A0D2AQR2_9PEZI|nr:uncharacterized protein PV09_00891 [Verruconis gallopava]KIW08993.1 hypothetical protein PV09_00891 [Verruconis gallopava]